jgi:hypothetical protein
MTSLSPSRPRLQMTGISYPCLSASRLDSAAVADATAGTGWSVHYHEAPDYQASLMLLPEDDDCLSAFVISAAEGDLCLEEVRDDTLHRLGRFTTLADTITELRRAIADQTDA